MKWHSLNAARRFASLHSNVYPYSSRACNMTPSSYITTAAASRARRCCCTCTSAPSTSPASTWTCSVTSTSHPGTSRSTRKERYVMKSTYITYTGSWKKIPDASPMQIMTCLGSDIGNGGTGTKIFVALYMHSGVRYLDLITLDIMVKYILHR